VVYPIATAIIIVDEHASIDIVIGINIRQIIIAQPIIAHRAPGWRCTNGNIQRYLRIGIAAAQQQQYSKGN
jgi:hypothetical protein